MVEVSKKLLKKPWKAPVKRAPKSILSQDRMKQLKDERKKRSGERKVYIEEIRRKKKAFYDAIREKKEQTKDKQRLLR